MAGSSIFTGCYNDVLDTLGNLDIDYLFHLLYTEILII